MLIFKRDQIVLLPLNFEAKKMRDFHADKNFVIDETIFLPLCLPPDDTASIL